ncbi:hypothetical protein [Paenibacillus polymyxa]|uniref:Uncharacterized protein n=1 Tax=Paenibacillus polymyxa (strain SC2) TaxID=886882 RepID=E3E582_PAEPS|nr:hypothetical protein [Paenibacillus polymyxa]ADO57441.1 hypothetical protein PPSC2_16315 [Paenibacillus polymyxa SC2]WPQ55214.1 hypothetical protein SKN87_16630 [Paenibacillus polymyxa]
MYSKIPFFCFFFKPFKPFKALKKATQMSDLYLPMYLEHQMNKGAYLKPEKRNSDRFYSRKRDAKRYAVA